MRSVVYEDVRSARWLSPPHGRSRPVRDIYLEIEQIRGYGPVEPEFKVTPPKVLFVVTIGCVPF